ncbi:hypothetical protein ACWGCW_14660 [Streptomyces sp. NPDC054933]
MPALPKHARAVRFDRYGGRDVLYLVDIPMPHSAPGEVLVEARVAGINLGETRIRTGALHDRFPAAFPSGQGSDLARCLEGKRRRVSDRGNHEPQAFAPS